MRNTILLITIISLTLTGNANAQPDTLWTQTYGGEYDEQCLSIILTTDGGFALAGWTSTIRAGDWDFSLVRTDSDGEELWSQTYDDENRNICNSVIQTADGGFALAGYSQSLHGDIDRDFWLVVTDEEGEELWSQSYGGGDGDICYSLIQTADDGFVLAGYTQSFGEGDHDFWLVRIDEDGDELWSQTYEGEDRDVCYSIIETVGGGFVLAGYTRSFGAGSDFLLIKVDEDGEVVWSHNYSNENSAICYSAIQTRDGGFALAGTTYSLAEETWHFWLVRTDEDGDSLWSQTYVRRFADLCFQDGCNTIIQTPDGGFALAGVSSVCDNGAPANMWLVRTDNGGRELWSQNYLYYQNDEACFSAVQTDDNGFVMGGYKRERGDSDFLLVKTEPDPVSMPRIVEPEPPIEFTLFPAYPNPFNSTTRISYGLPVAAGVRIQAYDISGRLVETVVDEKLPAGYHSAVWNAPAVPSGVYLLRMESGRFATVRKVVLAR